MVTEKEIEAAIAAIDATWQVGGEVPFPFYPRELRKIAEAALNAAERIRDEHGPYVADSIACGACDVCPAVHVNLLDKRGAVYATARSPKIVDVNLVKLRRVLKPLGISIKTIWGTGIGLMPEDRARLGQLVASRTSGGVDGMPV